MKQFDLIISGGGMVGASLAHALANSGLRIAVIESFAISTGQQPSYDDRAIALSFGSRRILEAINVWSGLQDVAESIKQIHVSDRGHFGFARLHSDEEQVDALGYVVTARDLGTALLGGLESLDAVSLFCPANLSAFSVSEDRVTVTIETTDNEAQILTAPLLVAADGGRSFVREQLEIPVSGHDYGQSAIISNVSTSKPHAQVAYERFTESGPIALLPMTGQRSALVYTVASEILPEIMALDDAEFLALLQRRFGFRLGRFTRIGERLSYDLKLMQADRHVASRVALIGNAAHTIHPIAGQGFNLGLRDAAVLAEVIFSASQQQKDIGAGAVLKTYADWRQKDHQTVIRATDSMVKLFSNALAPVSLARNLGILTVDTFSLLRHGVARQAMGLSGRQSRLSRGLHLE